MDFLFVLGFFVGSGEEILKLGLNSVSSFTSSGDSPDWKKSHHCSLSLSYEGDYKYRVHLQGILKIRSCICNYYVTGH